MLSPRSSNYERLEGGLGPSRLGIRNIVWRRIVFYLALAVGVVWLLRPSGKRVWNIKTPTPGESS
jgi:guanosine-diphosphatase